MVFEFFEEELDQWRRIARISNAKEDKKLKYRGRFERTCAKQLYEEGQKHEQDRRSEFPAQAFKPRKFKSLEAREVQHFREILQFHKNRAIALKNEEWLALTIEPLESIAAGHSAIREGADKVLEDLGSHRPIRCARSYYPARKVYSGQELHTRIRNMDMSRGVLKATTWEAMTIKFSEIFE